MAIHLALLAGTKRFSPATNFSPKVKAIKPPTFHGTPQSTNPGDLLRKTLKHKVAEKMEDRVAAMPQCSPYALVSGSENSSPVFTRLNEKPRSAAAAAR